MANIIEITGNDIAALNDTDLRTLVGLLCESEYRASKLSTACITYGGHQDASDGGLDVVVDCDMPPKNGFITRASTGIQVKKPKMPRGQILKEMKPNGVLRNRIKSLIDNGGAYFIISSGDSTTDKTLKSRKDAMREAIRGEDGYENILLDFFDRDRLATWVRDHPSLILWVRSKTGNPITGWSAYDNWSNSPGGLNEEYLYDSNLVIFDGTRSNDKRISIEEGFSKLRAKLSRPRASVRLAGLSGVGKTRVAQALFDERIGANSLNKSQVFYTDISNTPLPEPGTFAEQLIAAQTDAIIIVDNCSRDLHERLTKICSSERSCLSLLTIEYDVRDDIPEETSVFRLEPASETLISKVIENRFPHISQVDTSSIAEFSGGNYRIAIALANTVGLEESLTGLKNEALFERLFDQRNEKNDDLLISASVLSLVYSFEGIETVSSTSELAFLGSLIGKTAAEMYRAVNTLKERDLIQSRNKWRAVLPHAIANRLAKRAFHLIPKDVLTKAFQNCPLQRLVQSFTRRLSYLHDCNIAVEITEDWLREDGWLGLHIHNLNKFGINVLNNIAPVAPEKTLEAIERAANKKDGEKFTSREHPHYTVFTRLLRQLAYDPHMFQRCTKLLCKYSLSESPNENQDSIRDILKSLFYIYLSGTYATPEDRSAIIEELAISNDRDIQQLGLYLLDATLEAWHFGSFYEFSFGARSRDYGYRPSTRNEVIHWYSVFIELAVNLSHSKSPEVSFDAKKCLADNFRGLWIKGGIHDELIDAAKKIHEKQAWTEGWIAVRNIRRLDGKTQGKESVEKLQDLENFLNPDNLLDKARAYLSSNHQAHLGLSNDFDDELGLSSREKVEEATQDIGKEVGRNDLVFKEILPELLISNCTRIYYFGKGLAESSSNITGTWSLLHKQFSKTLEADRKTELLVGYLKECNNTNPEFLDLTLDHMITDDVLGEWFPTFQIAFGIDEKGLQRLHHALNENRADIYQYRSLACGRSHEALTDDDLTHLLIAISSKKGGLNVALEILKMRFHSDKKDQKKYSLKLIKFSCEILAKYPFGNNQEDNDRLDYDLGVIASVCLKNPVVVFKNLCHSFNINVIALRSDGLCLIHLISMKP